MVHQHLALALIFDCDLYVLHSHDVTRLSFFECDSLGLSISTKKSSYFFFLKDDTKDKRLCTRSEIRRRLTSWLTSMWNGCLIVIHTIQVGLSLPVMPLQDRGEQFMGFRPNSKGWKEKKHNVR